jgi:hypothetical protein
MMLVIQLTPLVLNDASHPNVNSESLFLFICIFVASGLSQRRVVLVVVLSQQQLMMKTLIISIIIIIIIIIIGTILTTPLQQLQQLQL